MKNEKHTRKEIIDIRLQHAGWNINDRTQVVEEFNIIIDENLVREAPTQYAGHQYSDYVLLGKDGKPLYKKEDWTKYDLLYSDIKTDTGVITFDKTAMAKKLGASEQAIVDEIISATKEAITNRTLVAIQRINTQISEQEKS